MSDELLEALLRAALDEGALDAESLPRFAQALRDRAALILADRIQPVEERAASFETETAWRAGVMAGFEEEKKTWQAERTVWQEEAKTWQDAHARLTLDREAQVAEVLGLQQEREALLEQHQRSTAEREALLEQHRRSVEEREGLVEQHRRAMDEREALLEQDRRRIEECRKARAEVEALQAHAGAERLARLHETESRDREIEALKTDVETLKTEAEALKTEMEAKRREKDVASAVHDRLLAHHRATLAHVAETVRGVSRDLPWSYRRARAALLELLRLLEKDTP